AHRRDGQARTCREQGRRTRRQSGGLRRRWMHVLPDAGQCETGGRRNHRSGDHRTASRLVGRGRARMVTAEELAARADLVTKSADLRALLTHLRERARPLLDRMPVIPEQKALLTSDGGFCPDDGTALVFDPWSPIEHRCPHCGKAWRGERHGWNWARFQHLWLTERAAHLAAVAGVGGVQDRAAASRACEILSGYAERYWRYPNRDNVLGP